MPMFPDSGVPPGEAINTLPEVTSVPCDELWYSTSRCQPRFDPAAANAMLAEDMNIVIRGEVQYDCLKLDNLERAIRYIVQRGLARSCLMEMGPFAYTGKLDPKTTRYNDFMTLTVIPVVSNQAAVTLDLDGLGVVPILRNDGQQLKSMDMRAGVPAIIGYYSGNWYVCGLVASQVPLVVAGGLDFWIRHDGNDITGDGTANTADKAFQTIAGCWAAVGARFAATPSFSINMRLGHPGTFAGAGLNAFGGNVSLTGDEANRTAYRISSILGGNNVWTNFTCIGMANIQFRGITFVRDVGPPYGMNTLWGSNSNVSLRNCDFDSTAANPLSTFIQSDSGTFITTDGYYNFFGRGLTIGTLIGLDRGSVGYLGGNNNIFAGVVLFGFYDCPVAACCYNLRGVSVFSQVPAVFANYIFSNVTGVQYAVSQNSVLASGGQAFPGTVVGQVGSGGQVT